MKATRLLMDEHKQIIRALYILEEMADCIERGEPVDERDSETMLHFMKVFAGDHHQGKEEAVLFPAMLRACPEVQMASLRHMVFEHNQERSLVEGLEDALRTRQGAGFVYFARRLAGILRNHIHKEDHILFGIVDEILTEDDDTQTVCDLESYDREWREKALDELLERVRKLERKYMARKPGVGSRRYA